jgi:hypothetical protein
MEYFDPKEEQKYEKLRGLSQELKLPITEPFLNLTVYDKDGNLKNEYKSRSHSWNRNAYNIFFGVFTNTISLDYNTFDEGYLSLKRSNSPYSLQDILPRFEFYNDWSQSAFNGDIGTSDRSIVVGSGNDPESFEGYTLQTWITNGTGSGQLSYQAKYGGTYSYNAETKTWSVVHKRFFNNNSGSSVTVREVGLILTNGYWVDQKILLSRDVLLTEIILEDADQLVVEYTINMVFPA